MKSVLTIDMGDKLIDIVVSARLPARGPQDSDEPTDINLADIIRVYQLLSRPSGWEMLRHNTSITTEL